MQWNLRTKQQFASARRRIVAELRRITFACRVLTPTRTQFSLPGLRTQNANRDARNGHLRPRSKVHLRVSLSQSATRGSSFAPKTLCFTELSSDTELESRGASNAKLQNLVSLSRRALDICVPTKMESGSRRGHVEPKVLSAGKPSVSQLKAMF